ncbi:MAG: Rpn family recombination-promoting nuclease/putative transposase [Lachnospiraceae bacterium]|nr:Rpn family recombination-promoting nuclease/putative transposase [Lachnospiraceae bacterium]
MTEKENTMPLPQNYKDVSNQELFKNHVLCAQFLRDYSSCKVFAQVQPEDIEDISERFTSIMGTKAEGDTVKRIRLRDAAGEELEVYAVSLIEHKSDVDYDVVMQLLHYISNIWRDYARSRQYQTEGGSTVETNKAKSFRYPPVLPIVYYEGKKKWTAGMRLRDRVLQVEGLEDFIPDFAYRLVRIHDYSNADLLDQADEMSLIMLLNKIQTPEDLQEMLKLSGAEVNEIVRDSEENVMDIVCDVVYLLCRKMNLPAEETRELLTQLKEGRNMGYLFENMEHMDIQAERRERMQAQKSLEDAERKLEDAEEKLDDTEKKLNDAEEKLDDTEKKLNDAEGKLNDAEEKLGDAEKKLDATEHERDEAYKSCLRLCKKYALQKEAAVSELLENSSLTPEMAREIVSQYWEVL